MRGTGLRRWSGQEVGRWVAGSVLIEYDREGRPSMEIKLLSELSPPVFVVVVNYRRPLIASRVGCASARKLFFSQRKVGVGLGKGARACG